MIPPKMDWRTEDDAKVRQRLVRWPDFTAVYANSTFPGAVRFRRKIPSKDGKGHNFGKLYPIDPALYRPFLEGSCPVEVVLDDLAERHPALAPKLYEIVNGRPFRDPKPTVPEVLPLVRALYESEHGGAGGCLHIVLDERNVEDSSVRFCIESGCCEQCLPVALLLQKMSRTQRGKLANLATSRHGAEMLAKYRTGAV